MADNAHRKSHKLLDNKKTSNPIHRATTETIRLGEPDKHIQTTSVSLPNHATNNQCRKKTSSFQITSVTVGCRTSNDTGEDSNDDLDESHTEDNSVEHSRVTDIDIETPSYSEDTFSKEDVFFNTSNAALSTAPVIPTSSQYGLAIVPSEGNNVNNSVNDNNINTLDISSVTDNNIINLLSSNAKQDPDIREVHSHGRNERFKVVKIESTEPFKRGRWTCMDYLDHTSFNQSTAINTLMVSDPNEVCISYGITDSGVVIPDVLKQSAVSDDKSVAIEANQLSQQEGHVSVAGTNKQPVSGANYNVNSSMAQNIQHNNAQVQNQGPQMSQYFQPSSQQHLNPQSQQVGQGATLPSNLQPTHPNNLGQPQSMPQGSIPIITQPNNNNATSQQNVIHSKEEPYITVSPQPQTVSAQNVCQPNVPPPISRSTVSSPANPSANILVGNVSSQHQNQQAHPPQQQHQPQSPVQPQQQQQQPISSQVSEKISGMTGVQSVPSIHKVPQSVSQQTPPTIHGPVSSMPPQSNNSNSQLQITSTGCQNVVPGIQPGPIPFHHTDQDQDSSSTLVISTTSQSADAALIESLAEMTQSNDEHHTLEDNESMSGTSAVAIDNKIEQAMDLVKSHLMFAVREEVEVLKEKIAELMDRINQLEAENSILKSHATPDALAQLSNSQLTTKLPQNNSGNGQ